MSMEQQLLWKNNVPRYLVIDFNKAEQDMIAKDEDVLSISKRLIEKNMEAYEELAKWYNWQSKKNFYGK